MYFERRLVEYFPGVYDSTSEIEFDSKRKGSYINREWDYNMRF